MVAYCYTSHDDLRVRYTERCIKLAKPACFGLSLCIFTVKKLYSKGWTGHNIIGIIFPQAAVYFNKIQCFCFEEQRLLPGEQIDMPVMSEH